MCIACARPGKPVSLLHVESPGVPPAHPLPPAAGAPGAGAPGLCGTPHAAGPCLGARWPTWPRRLASQRGRARPSPGCHGPGSSACWVGRQHGNGSCWRAWWWRHRAAGRRRRAWMGAGAAGHAQQSAPQPRHVAAGGWQVLLSDMAGAAWCLGTKATSGSATPLSRETLKMHRSAPPESQLFMCGTNAGAAVCWGSVCLGAWEHIAASMLARF